MTEKKEINFNPKEKEKYFRKQNEERLLTRTKEKKERKK